MGLVKPKRVVIDYGEFELEIVIRPKALRVLVERVEPGRPAREPEVELRPRRLAVVLDEALDLGRALEDEVPEGTTIYEASGPPAEGEVRLSDKLIRVPSGGEEGLLELAVRLSGEFARVLVFTTSLSLARALRARALGEGITNLEVHFLPHAEDRNKAELVEEVLRRISEALELIKSRARPGSGEG